jgi:hypothetical protein
MDTNAGRFVEEADAEKWMQRLEVGEVVEIKGEELTVLAFDNRRVVLELRSADDRVTAELAAGERLVDLREQLQASRASKFYRDVSRDRKRGQNGRS